MNGGTLTFYAELLQEVVRQFRSLCPHGGCHVVICACGGVDVIDWYDLQTLQGSLRRARDRDLAIVIR